MVKAYQTEFNWHKTKNFAGQDKIIYDTPDSKKAKIADRQLATETPRGASEFRARSIIPKQRIKLNQIE